LTAVTKRVTLARMIYQPIRQGHIT
jgi:hypothetical protein